MSSRRQTHAAVELVEAMRGIAPAKELTYDEGRPACFAPISLEDLESSVVVRVFQTRRLSGTEECPGTVYCSHCLELMRGARGPERDAALQVYLEQRELQRLELAQRQVESGARWW